MLWGMKQPKEQLQKLHKARVWQSLGFGINKEVKQLKKKNLVKHLFLLFPAVASKCYLNSVLSWISFQVAVSCQLHSQYLAASFIHSRSNCVFINSWLHLVFTLGVSFLHLYSNTYIDTHIYLIALYTFFFFNQLYCLDNFFNTLVLL